MAALLALLCFVLALFKAKVGEIDLVVLGFVFIALALLLGNWPINKWPSARP